jgi:hypothetical protein
VIARFEQFLQTSSLITVTQIIEHQLGMMMQPGRPYSVSSLPNRSVIRVDIPMATREELDVGAGIIQAAIIRTETPLSQVYITGQLTPVMTVVYGQ